MKEKQKRKSLACECITERNIKMNKFERLKEKLLRREQIVGTNIVLTNSPPMLELINEDYLDNVTSKEISSEVQVEDRKYPLGI